MASYAFVIIVADSYEQNPICSTKTIRKLLSWFCSEDCHVFYITDDMASHPRQGSSRLYIVQGIMKQGRYISVLESQLEHLAMLLNQWNFFFINKIRDLIERIIYHWNDNGHLK